MADEQPNNPLHGITLKALLTQLVEEHGWEALAERVRIQCFQNNPSINSSLKFLRKTPWARAKVEALYLSELRLKERKKKRNLRRAARRAYAEQMQSQAPTDAPEPEASDTEEASPGWSFDRS